MVLHYLYFWKSADFFRTEIFATFVRKNNVGKISDNIRHAVIFSKKARFCTEISVNANV